jgi:Flp pilus assembly pilin Flp
MVSLINQLKRFARGNELIRDERGLSTVEYVIILVLIAVMAIGVWQTFGASIMAQVSGSTTAIDGLNAGSSTDTGNATD